MVKKRSEERRMQEMVELGRENAELYPKVTGWCRHLQVRMVSAGLLAEWYGLPIGSMEITCEYAAAGGIQAMLLREVAAYFIANNCRSCSFHETLDLDNIGHVILREREEIQVQRQAEAEPVDLAKARLQELVSGNLTEALHREEITARSILELVALLEDQTHHVEAAKKLVRASEIAAELFPEIAVQIICSHFLDANHGQDCIICVRRLGQQTGQIPEFAWTAAKRCLAEHRHVDTACTLICDYVVQRDSLPDQELVDAIVGVQSHGHFLGSLLPRHREYPGSTYALKEIGKRDLASLINVLKNRLARNEKYTRISAAYVVQSLIDTFPELALNLIDALIDSLELDDDPYEDSADGTACETLAAIYVRHPNETQEKLEAGYRRASEEAKAVLYSVYRHITSDPHWFSAVDKEKAALYHACVAQIIPYLLQAIGAFGNPLDVKTAATGALEMITHDHATLLVNHLDTLLGTLANLVYEQVLLSSKQVEGTLAELEKQGDQAQYGAIVRRVVDALEAICDLEPRQMLGRLKEIVPKLNSTQPHLARYKCELAALYGRLGARHELTPEVIPDLYKLLMDFDSVLVRGAAVEAIGTILQKRADVVPQNMIEILIHYLSDTYVYVHKSAARAMRHVRPRDLEEAATIAYRLLVLDKIYDDDPYFRREILRALIHITWDYSQLLTAVTVPVIIKHAQISDLYIAEDALEDFDRLLPRLPKEYTPLFAREVLAFLGRSQRDRYNDETYSGRYRLLLSLYELPREAITNNLSVVQETARAKAKSDPWDALRMVQLLSHVELHSEATRLGQEIVAAQPKTKRYEWIVREATVISALAQVEVLVAEGKADEALKLLEEIALLEGERDENEKARESRDAIDALAVAERIANRIARIQVG
jgi:hypothetical protein